MAPYRQHSMPWSRKRAQNAPEADLSPAHHARSPPIQSPVKVFLTGASSGLGSALARRYAAEGAVLGLYARRADSLQQLAGTLAPEPASSTLATCAMLPRFAPLLTILWRAPGRRT